MKKFLSVLLSICMLLTVFSGITTVSAADAKIGQIADGSSNAAISIGGTDSNNQAVITADIGGIGGKAESDVIFKVEKTVGNGSEGRCQVMPQLGFKMGVRSIMSFDILFTAEDNYLIMGYAAAKEGATSADASQCNNINNLFTIGPNRGVKLEGMYTLTEGTLPTSLSLNQWHNFAFEVPNDGTSTAYVYVDGVRYTGYFHVKNDPTTEYKSYGVRHNRLNLGKGTYYIDNYYTNIAQQEGFLYDAEKYAKPDISVSESEKVSYNAESKQFTLIDESLTAGELKNLINASKGTVKIYENGAYKNLIEDTDTVDLASKIVVECENGVFGYYDFFSENTSDFEIAVNGDGITCTVTGFKEGKVPTEAETAVTIPDVIAGYPVTGIGAKAFDRIKTLGAFTMPDTIKKIGDNAFEYCYGIDIAKWPDDLEEIGKSAFFNAKTNDGLKSIITGDLTNTKLKKLGDESLSCSAIGRPLFPDTLEYIGAAVFRWCSAGDIVIPDSVTYMGKDIFKTCFSSLKSIRFPENEVVTAIPEGIISSDYPADAGKLCGNVGLYIPANITTIPYNTLKDIKSGATVTIYGEMGSAAQAYAEEINKALASGTYKNDAGGALAEVKFVEYDFKANSVAVDETGINTGSEKINIVTPKNDPVLTTDVAGLGGKKAEDTVISLYATSGNNGTNYIPVTIEKIDGVYVEPTTYEISLMTPESGEARVNLAYYYTEGKTSAERYSEDIVKVSSAGVSLLSTKVADAIPGRWFTIGVETPKIGDTQVTVYINGKAYTIKLKGTYYGLARYSLYTNGGTIHFDNYRKIFKGNYSVKKDTPATVTAKDDTIRIIKNNIVYNDENAKYTAAELKAKIETDDYSRANVRIYSDSSLTTLLKDDDIVPDLAVVVVAATNGYSHERVFSYYEVNPPINTTLYAISPNADGKTATVTGWNTEIITEVDDLSIIAIPEKIAGYTITAIGNNAFKDNEIIESVTLPDTVETIGNYAFAGKVINPTVYGKIKNIKWPKNLKKIGNNAFAYQTALTEIELPYGVESIGSYAFYWINGLKKAVLPESVTSMGENVFRICQKLEYVKLPGGIKQIPKDTFAGVSSLKTLIIPAGIESDYGTLFNDYTTVSPVVYGVLGTYAEKFAAQHGYNFVGSIGGVINIDKIVTEADKALVGSSYDIRQNYKKLYATGEYVNISKEDVDAKLMIAAYDDLGNMVAFNSKDVPIGIGETVSISIEDNVFIDELELKDGYKIKTFLWEKDTNMPLTGGYEILMDENKEEYHVILIGNSYGNDSFGHIVQIAEADNVTIKAYNLYIGGGALYKQHYKYALDGTAAYQPVINMVYMSDRVSMEQGLKSDNWDYVALQANSTNGSREWFFAPDYTEGVDANGVKYSEYWSTVSEKVSEWAPNAKKLTHMTWGTSDEVSYNSIMSLKGLGEKWGWSDLRNAGYTGYNDERYVFGTAREIFYNAVKDRYEEGNMHYTGDPSSIIPSAVAIYLAITKYGFDEFVLDEEGNYIADAPAMYRDTTCHLGTPYGRILAGLTWYETITGNDVTQNPFQYGNIPEEHMARLKAAAHEACQMYRADAE